MDAKAKVLGHAVHPMLIVFPLGLLTMTPIFDVVQIVTKNALWAQLSFWLTVCGLLGGLAAAVFGFIDWFFAVPPRTRAYRVGLTHMLVNLAAVAAFVVAFVFRVERRVMTPGYAPFALDLIGLAILLVGGWLGGELVQQHAIAVNDNAHANAPSSLDTERLVRRERELPSPTVPSPTEPQPA